ncbi:MAG: glycoside hydrolase family 31 protein, partial [Spirochaetia bacterium]
GMGVSPVSLFRTTISFPFPGQVELRVQSHPLGLTFHHRGRRVLATARAAAVSFLRDGVETRSRSLVSWTRDPGDRMRVVLRASTEMTGVDLVISVEAMSSWILMSVRCSDDGATEALGFSFAAPRGEFWYGADVLAASQWPLNARAIRRDPFLPTGNQTAPLWLSSRGVALFKQDYQPVGFSFHGANGTFRIHGRDASRFDLCLSIADDIRQAHRTAISVLGIPRSAPPPEYFRKPVFCTWIEFLTNVHQQGVLDYVRAMYGSGFQCGVLMIDDKWMRRYGDLEFDPEKFPGPGRMVEALHAQDIRVALWMTPFIDRESSRYVEACRRGYLLRKKGTSEPFLGQWWNGASALIDLSDPEARAWFVDGLRALVRTYSVDGFKLDAGDAEVITGGYDSFAPMNPWEYADAFASIGAEFEINELRVSWLTQKLGLVQRLRDKSPTWSPVDGLASIIPHGLCEGLLGYPYFCADMIGGGWDAGFQNGQQVDEELFVRWTQASALLPIMQFSYAPWRLTQKMAAICRRYVKLHEDLSGFIYCLAQDATRDGTPIVKPLFFNYPKDRSAYRVRDQFLLGDRFLVAPVLTRGARHRPVYLPEGAWRDYWSGMVFSGPRLIKAYDADLEKLPLFEAGENTG